MVTVIGLLTRRFYVETVEFTAGICDGIDPLKEGGGGINTFESTSIFANTPLVQVSKPSYDNP